jgi:AraC-like DNA-binding protein
MAGCWQMKTDRITSYQRGASGLPELLLPRFQALDSRDCNSLLGISKHQHENYEIIFTEQGNYACHLNGERIAMAAYSVLLIKPGDWHEDILSPGLRYLALRLQVDYIGVPEARKGILIRESAAGQRWFRAKKREFHPLLQALQRESESGDRFSPHLHDAIAAQLLWNALRHLPESILSPELLHATQQSRFSSRINRFFEDHYSGACDVAEMARWMGMSERLLHLRCKLHLGISPAKAFTEFRLERAHLLVRESNLSIKDISARLGFANPYHFSKVYRRIYKKSPSSDRRKDLQK